MTIPTGAAGAAVAPEELTWEPAVALHGESRAPEQGERGFRLRLHVDPVCADRLVPGGRLVPRDVERAPVSSLCGTCCAPVLATGHSSHLRRLYDARRVLERMLEGRGDEPVPRQTVHCRALRYEAEQVTSVHPAVLELAAEVAATATEVAEVLRERLREALAPRRDAAPLVQR